MTDTHVATDKAENDDAASKPELITPLGTEPCDGCHE